MKSVLSGWPMCARCNKPVDALTQHHNGLTRNLVVVAHCHGALERSVLTPRDMATMGRAAEMTVAFTQDPAVLQAPGLPERTRE